RTKVREDECWEWVGARSSKGYGRLFDQGRHWYAHRVAYELYNGPISPSHLLVCHSCDNPRCVNPDHLFLGSHQDNLNDLRAKGRAKGRDPCVGENNRRAKLTEEKVLKIIELLDANRHSRSEIAEAFGVARETISHINTGISWNYLTKRSSR